MVDKLADDIGRARKAKELLENDLLKEAFATLETDYIAAWKLTPARDTDARERLWQAVQVVGKVRDHLSAVVNMDGRMAAAELQKIAQAEERKKRFGII